MGWITEGIAPRCASSSWSGEGLFAGGCGCSFFLRMVFLAVLAFFADLDFIGVALAVFALTASFSHSAPLRVAALRLLCHSAEPLSPAISSRLRWVNTE